MRVSFPWGPCRHRSKADPSYLAGLSDDSLHHYFDIQDRLSTVLGGYGLMLRMFDHFSRSWDPARPISVLNLGCQRGDWAQHLSEWAKRRRFELSILAVDANVRNVSLAKDRVRSMGVSFDCRDVDDPIFLQAQQVDYVVSAVQLSSYSHAQAHAFLKKVNLLSKRGFVVMDSVRDVRRWIAIAALSKIIPDILCSEELIQTVTSSFSVSEILALVDRADLEGAKVLFPAGLWSIISYERALASMPKMTPVVGWAGA